MTKVSSKYFCQFLEDSADKDLYPSHVNNLEDLLDSDPNEIVDWVPREELIDLDLVKGSLVTCSNRHVLTLANGYKKWLKSAVVSLTFKVPIDKLETVNSAVAKAMA